ANGLELWKTDGTAAGTVLVKDINPGANDSYPGYYFADSGFVASGGALFFYAQTNAAGGELWKTDGSAAGTVMVKDIEPGAGSSAPDDLLDLGGVLYFRAATSSAGFELWKSDGTVPGTVMVKDIEPGVGSSYPSALISIGGAVYFNASTTAA